MTLPKTAKVQTSLGEDALLFLMFDGTDAMGQPFEYEVDLLSKDLELDFTKLLGQPMLVEIELQDGGKREFNGLVTRFVSVGSLGTYARYRATLRPWFWLMTRRNNCRIFQQQTVPQVVMALFREHQFSDFEDKLTQSYREWEYLVQYRESDFNFVSRMLEQEGIYYYFRHEGGKHILVLADSYSAHEPVPGYETIPYIAKTQDHNIHDNIDSWGAVLQITSGAFASNDYDFERPKAEVGSTLKPGADYPGGDYEIYDYPGEFADTPEADVQVKLRLEAELTQHDIVSGEGNARGIQAGALMSMIDFPRADQNKEYLVFSTSISIRTSTHESLIDSAIAPEEPTFRVSFGATDSKRPFRVGRVTKKPVVRGPQTAVVVGQSGQEIWTDKYGRVKLQFRWDREGEFDENSSCWVRVSQLWAGSGWGGMHIPRIGQEVIVDFLEGNPDRPFISGRLYNADNMPSYDLPANQTQSYIKSHSTKGGGIDNFNEIRFEDKLGEELLNMQAEKDMTTLVKNDQTNTILANRSSTITKNDSVTVNQDRSLTVAGTNTISVTKSDTEDYKDTRTVTVTGPDTLEITKSHEGTYKDTRTLTIKGPDKVTVQSVGKTNDVTGKYEHIASEEYEARQGKNIVNMKGSICKVTNGKCSITLDDGKITIEAPDEIALKVGDNTLKIHSGGTIDLTALSATTVSGAQASMALDGSGAAVSGPKVGISGQGGVDVMGCIIKLN